MREYELIFIVHPEADEANFTEAVNRVRTWIEEDGGEVIKTDLWGKRRLAYPIRKQIDGQYVFMHIKMEPRFGIILERNLRFLEPVIRFLVVAKETAG
jgi:small subunit ribosomal protein S6